LCATNFNVHKSCVSLLRAPQLSPDIPADAGFLCGKAAVFGAAIKEMPVPYYYYGVKEADRLVIMETFLKVTL
jgi:hypothetical protein